MKRESRKSAGPKAKEPRVSPARRSAFETLRRVEEEGAFASLLLASNTEELRAEDRALAYEIVLGCLRWQLWLDHLIEHYAGRSASKLDTPVRLALRIGLYQLRFLTRIPASAVVNESVNLAHAARVRSAAGLINAVLRRAVREPAFDPAANLADPLEKISVQWSHPLWLIRRWAAHFGLELAAEFAAANNSAPPVSFRIVRGMEESEKVLEQLRAAGAFVEPSRIAPEAFRVEGASAMVRELARRGLIYVQDEASQLVAHVLDARAGERILDACAAPGSKTTHIADRSNNGALVVAGDIYRHRLQTVLESAARQNLSSIRLLEHDAVGALPFPEAVFDRALVDAPCSGTGTLRRNPEIKWRITEEDIADLKRRQLNILQNVAKTVRPGGRLVYSTCSVEPEENEQVAADFLAENSAWHGVKVDAPAGLENKNDTARTWPHRDGADGFFIAAFERRD